MAPAIRFARALVAVQDPMHGTVNLQSRTHLGSFLEAVAFLVAVASPEVEVEAASLAVEDQVVDPFLVAGPFQVA